MKSIRIVNPDGLATNTKISDAETGEPLHGVESVKLQLGKDGVVIRAEVTFVMPEVDVVAHLEN